MKTLNFTCVAHLCDVPFLWHISVLGLLMLNFVAEGQCFILVHLRVLLCTKVDKQMVKSCGETQL